MFKNEEGLCFAELASVPDILPAALSKLSYLRFITNQEDNHKCPSILVLHLQKLIFKDMTQQRPGMVLKWDLNSGSGQNSDSCFNSGLFYLFIFCIFEDLLYFK